MYDKFFKYKNLKWIFMIGEEAFVKLSFINQVINLHSYTIFLK